MLLADSLDVRQRRLATLIAAQTYDVLPASVTAAERFAGLVAHARERGRRLKVNDAWIAAIAAANDAGVATQDDDFDGLPIEVHKL